MQNNTQALILKKKALSSNDDGIYVEEPLMVECTVEPAAFRYSISIKQEINDSEDYQELLAIIRQATPNDVLDVYLETNGGLLSVGLQLITELNRCPAQKYCYVASGTASMGTAIFLGVEWAMVDVDPLATFHFHSMSYGEVGKHEDVKETMLHNELLSNRMYETYYKDFLTEKELVDITVNKKELRLLGDDVVGRLKLKYEAMEAPEEDTSEEDFQGMPTLPTYAEVMKMKKLDLQELFIELFDLTEEVDNKEEVE